MHGKLDATLWKTSTRPTHFAHRSTIISGESSGHLIDSWERITHSYAIKVLSIGPHSCNCQELMVFNDTLLKLAEQDAES